MRRSKSIEALLPILYLKGSSGDFSEALAALLGMACIAVLRVAAIHWDLSLPVYHLPEEKR